MPPTLYGAIFLSAAVLQVLYRFRAVPYGIAVAHPTVRYRTVQYGTCTVRYGNVLVPYGTGTVPYRTVIMPYVN